MNRFTFVFVLLLASIAHAQEAKKELRALEIERLEKQIDAEIEKYNTYPRRLVVGMNPPNEIKTYLSSVLHRIEQIGTVNYPMEARGKIYGTALVEFQIFSTGAVDVAKIVRSSGYEVLDQAAIRTIRAAEPFAQFPPEVKQRADILVVVRRFAFENSAFSENALDLKRAE